jgi:hypothetical protein
MAVRKSYGWRTLYRETLLERDPQQLPEKIALAEGAIYARIKHLKASPKDQIERQALDDAVTALRDMKKRHFPGWNSRS